jgi:hypothetical protein
MWSSFSNGLRGLLNRSVLCRLLGWFASDGDNYHKMQMAARAAPGPMP